MDYNVWPVPQDHAEQSWPVEAMQMMARVDQAARAVERRRLPRWEYRVQGDLMLGADELSAARWTIFSKDINPWSCGFITHQVLPVYKKAMLRLPTPEEQVLHIRCQIRRCREFAPGWYKAAVDFDREEMIFLVP